MLEEDYMDKIINQINSVSNPIIVLEKLKDYCVKINVEPPELLVSTIKNKKYMIKNPYTNKNVHFGDIRYQDFTKHKDPIRRRNYLSRATKIKGDWQLNPFSPNNLSIHLLW